MLDVRFCKSAFWVFFIWSLQFVFQIQHVGSCRETMRPFGFVNYKVLIFVSSKENCIFGSFQPSENFTYNNDAHSRFFLPILVLWIHDQNWFRKTKMKAFNTFLISLSLLSIKLIFLLSTSLRLYDSCWRHPRFCVKRFWNKKWKLVGEDPHLLIAICNWLMHLLKDYNLLCDLLIWFSIQAFPFNSNPVFKG